jgi:PadR family transcriptional regulator PadR
MKETGLGEFEEVILLLVGILGEEAYSFKIAEEFESQTSRSVSIGAVHSTLNRLEEKGFLKSAMGKSTAERGGRRKRIYTITAYGRRALEAARDFRVSLWSQYPAFANKANYGLESGY